MYAVCVTFQVNAGSIDQFMPLMQQQATLSLNNELACQRFDVCTNPDRPNEVFLYEIYDDARAFQTHLKTEHFIEFDRAVSDMVTSKTVDTFPSVFTS